MLYQKHEGNVSAVARELGVTHAAIQKRLMKTPDLKRAPKPIPQVAAEVADATALSDQERQLARGLLVQAGKVAHESATVKDLVHAAQGLIDLANSRDKAHQLALTYIDQRSVNVQGGGMTEEVLDAAAARVVAEVLPLLCPACQQAVAALEGT